MSLRSIRKLLGFETKSKVVARLMDNRKRTAFLIYAQTLCTTPHNSFELYVELHTGLMHRFCLCPQPLLPSLSNNFKNLGKREKSTQKGYYLIWLHFDIL